MSNPLSNRNGGFSPLKSLLDLCCGADHGAVLGGLVGVAIWYLVSFGFLEPNPAGYNLLCLSSIAFIFAGAVIGALIGSAINRYLY